jgi:K+-transporting ATPase ATPase B chain
MFVVYVGSMLTTLFVQALRGQGEAPSTSSSRDLPVAVVHGVVREFRRGLAEGRSKAQAASLRGMKQSIQAKKLKTPQHGSEWVRVPRPQLRKGDVFPGRGGRCHSRPTAR